VSTYKTRGWIILYWEWAETKGI